MSQDSTIPRGYCQCGCGQKTRLAPRSNTEIGWLKGQPISYINGHQGRSKLSDEERFWSYVDRSGGENACWPWIGGRYPGGYGHAFFAGKLCGAHTVAWFLTHGEWATQNVLHRCDNPPCCNPKCLFQGSQLENMMDKVQKGRSLKGEKHPNAKLNNKKVRNIRKLYAKGWPQRIIAEHYGVNQTIIGDVLRGETWTHVI